MGLIHYWQNAVVIISTLKPNCSGITGVILYDFASRKSARFLLFFCLKAEVGHFSGIRYLYLGKPARVSSTSETLFLDKRAQRQSITIDVRSTSSSFVSMVPRTGLIGSMATPTATLAFVKSSNMQV